MKKKSKVPKPAATPNGTAGKPPTATPSATGTTRTRAAVATVMSDRKGRRPAVASARPARVTIQPATMRRVRLPVSTIEAYGGADAGRVFAPGSCQERSPGHQQSVNERPPPAGGAYHGLDVC